MSCLFRTGNVTWFNAKEIWISLLESRGGSKLEQKISPFDDFIFKLQFDDDKPGETKIETHFSGKFRIMHDIRKAIF